MLRVESVTKAWGRGRFGVRELSLEALPGVLGLIGPNGAGKTTLMQMIATLTRPTGGRIVFDGVDVVRDPEAVRRRLGYLPQDFGVYDNLTALELLDYVGRLKGIRSRERAMEMLEVVNLHHVAGRPVGGFSGGMRQRLGIAQALVGDPDLLIVDEPTAGLDPEERVRFRNLLSGRSGRRLVIVSTHIVSDVESIAGEIAVVRAGRLVASGPPEALMRKASGTAWEAVLASGEFERLREGLTVSSLVRRGDGVRLRVVAAERPLADAVAVEPDLEDAYLALMQPWFAGVS
jgi:ABC-type multidrug transport system ATPase subunit